MTREELRDKMMVAGELERFTKTENWKQAFELYKFETKDKEVSLECSGCFKKIKNWLTR